MTIATLPMTTKLNFQITKLQKLASRLRTQKDHELARDAEGIVAELKDIIGEIRG